jgi:hypothetical protein
VCFVTFDPRRLSGRTALVTGASAGIGASFARALGAAGADLVLVARRADRLADLADDLRNRHGRTVHVHAADIAARGAVDRLSGELAAAGVRVDVLVNNAGVGLPAGPFHEADPATLTAMLDLNIVALTEMTRTFLPPMVAAGYGAVVNVASTAAFQPLARVATYAATKAYVLSLTEAVWAETFGTGVRVLAVCPGMTVTEFFETAGAQPSGAQVQTADEVVAEAMAALARRGPTLVTGGRNRILSLLPRLLPRGVTARVADRSTRTTRVPTAPQS